MATDGLKEREQFEKERTERGPQGPARGWALAVREAREDPNVTADDIEAINLRYGFRPPEDFNDKAVMHAKTTWLQKATRTGQAAGEEVVRIATDSVEVAAKLGQDAANKMGVYQVMDPNGEHPEFAQHLARGYASTIGLLFQAAEAGRKAEKAVVTSPELKGRGGYGEQLAPALASGAMILGGGALAAGARLPVILGTMPMGAMMNGAPAYLDAEAAGASDEEKWQAFFAVGAFGAAAEHIGLSGPLRKIAGVAARADKASGGKISKTVVSTAFGIGKEAVKTGAGEAGTEAAQQAFADLFHEHITDEDRDVLGNILGRGGALEMGFVAGLIFGGLSGAPAKARPEVGPPPATDLERRQATTAAEGALLKEWRFLQQEQEGLAQGTEEFETLQDQIDEIEELLIPQPAEVTEPAVHEEEDVEEAARRTEEAAKVPSITEQVEKGEIAPARKDIDEAKKAFIKKRMAEGRSLTEAAEEYDKPAAEGGPAPEETLPPLSPTEEPSAAPSKSAEAAARAGKAIVTRGYGSEGLRRRTAEGDKIIRKATKTEMGDKLNTEQVRAAAKALHEAGFREREISERLKGKASLVPSYSYEAHKDRLRGLRASLKRGKQTKSLDKLKAWRKGVESDIAAEEEWLARNADEMAMSQGIRDALGGVVEEELAKRAKFPEYTEKPVEQAAAEAAAVAPKEKKADERRFAIRKSIGLEPGQEMAPEQIGRSAQAAQEQGLTQRQWREAIRKDLSIIGKKRRTQQRLVGDLEHTEASQVADINETGIDIRQYESSIAEEKDRGLAADQRRIFELKDLIKQARENLKSTKGALADTRQRLKEAGPIARLPDSMQGAWDAATNMMFGKDEAKARQSVREATDTTPLDVVTPGKYADAIKALRQAKEDGLDIPKAKAREIFDRMTDGVSSYDQSDYESMQHRQQRAQEEVEYTKQEGAGAGESVADFLEARKNYEDAAEDYKAILEEIVTPEQFDRMWGPDSTAAEPDYETAGVTEAPWKKKDVARDPFLEPDFGGAIAAGRIHEKMQQDRMRIRIRLGLQPGDEFQLEQLPRSAEVARQMGLSRGDWDRAITEDVVAAHDRKQEELERRADKLQEEYDAGLASSTSNEEVEAAYEKYTRAIDEMYEGRHSSLDPYFDRAWNFGATLQFGQALKRFLKRRPKTIFTIREAVGLIPGEKIRRPQLHGSVKAAQELGLTKAKWKEMMYPEVEGTIHQFDSDSAWLDKVWEVAQVTPEQKIDKIVEMHAGVPVPKAVRDAVRAEAEAAKDWLRAKQRETGLFMRDTSHLDPGFQRGFYQIMVDRLQPVQKAQELIKARGGAVTPETDFHLQESLVQGVTADRLGQADRDFFKPLIRKIKAMHKKTGETLEKIDEYFQALHAPERNKALVLRQKEFKDLRKKLRKAQIDGDMIAENKIQTELNLLWGDVVKGDADLDWDLEKNPPSGMSNSDAQAIVQAFESKHGVAGPELARAFQKMNAETLRILRDAGLISSELHDTLGKLYPNYAPLRTMMESELGYGTGPGEPLKRAKGRKSLADSPLAFAMSQLQGAVMRAEKNRVLQGMRTQMQESPEAWEGFAKGYTPQVAKKLKMRMDDRTLKVWIDGEPHLIRFEEEYDNVARAMSKMNVLELGKMTSLSGTWTRMMAQLSTRLNPAFFGPNGIRDLVTGYMHSLEHGAGFATAVGADTLPAVHALLNHAFRGAKGDWASLIERYEKAGARITFLDLKNPQSFLDSLQSEIASATGKESKIRGFAQGFSQMMEGLSDSVENAIRLSYFKHATEKLGMSDAEAALASKDLTTNFERRGDWGSVMNQWFMFSNAGIQGVDRVRRAHQNSTVRKATAMSFATMIGYGYFARWLMGDDKDGTPLWDKIPAYEKDSHFILPTGWATGDPMSRISIPLPRVYSFANSVAHHIPSAMSGHTKPGKAMGNVVQSAIQEFWPTDLSQGTATAFGIPLPVPTVGQIPVQLLSNRDWKGDLIHPARYAEGVPKFAQAWEASPAAMGIAKSLNWLSGGDEYTSGFADAPPESIDHFFNTAVGGLGATVNRTFGSWAYVMKGEAPPHYEIPIWRRFYKGTSPYRTNASFGEVMTDLERTHRRNRAEDEDVKPTSMLSAGRKAKKEAKELRDKAREAKTESQKQRLLDEADDIMQDFIRNYRSGTSPSQRGGSRSFRGGSSKRRGFR